MDKTGPQRDSPKQPVSRYATAARTGFAGRMVLASTPFRAIRRFPGPRQRNPNHGR